MNVFYEVELAKNLKGYETRCRGKENGKPCCCHGAVRCHPNLVTIFQAFREALGSALTPTNWFRCKEYNGAVRGHVRSYHLWGGAADVTNPLIRNEMEKWARVVAALMVKFLPPGHGNVIMYPDNAFIHIDVGLTVDPEHMIRIKTADGTMSPYDWRP